MTLKTLLVMLAAGSTWVRDWTLPIPPFVGLGIRIDKDNMLNVDSVVVADPRYDVTCIVHLREANIQTITEDTCRALGFEEGLYPL